jgi:hypothetical protein
MLVAVENDKGPFCQQAAELDGDFANEGGNHRDKAAFRALAR